MPLRYPVEVVHSIEEGKKRFTLTCPLVPEPIAWGNSLEKALEELHSMLLFTASEVYFKGGKIFPIPDVDVALGCFVELSTGESLKLMLLNTMTEEKLRPIDMANRMGIPRQNMTRILNPKNKTSLEILEKAISCTGKRISCQLV